MVELRILVPVILVRVEGGDPLQLSSMVEHSAVNRAVVGSSPTVGAISMG